MKNPIVVEIDKYREEHARKFNYDLDAICEGRHAMQREKGLNASQTAGEEKGSPTKMYLTASCFPDN